jgi:peptidyl-tRNA hydrolase
MPVEEYVLRKFSPTERVLIDEAIDDAKNAVISIISDGIERAMNKFN